MGIILKKWPDYWWSFYFAQSANQIAVFVKKMTKQNGQLLTRDEFLKHPLWFVYWMNNILLFRLQKSRTLISPQKSRTLISTQKSRTPITWQKVGYLFPHEKSRSLNAPQKVGHLFLNEKVGHLFYHEKVGRQKLTFSQNMKKKTYGTS